MDLQRINQHKSLFDKIQQHISNDDGSEQVEVWFARELQELLGYARWENFLVAIGRAVDSCKTQGINVDDHFREVTKMVKLGSGAKRVPCGGWRPYVHGAGYLPSGAGAGQGAVKKVPGRSTALNGFWQTEKQ